MVMNIQVENIDQLNNSQLLEDAATPWNLLSVQNFMLLAERDHQMLL
jgi:hypothetical protein